MLSVIVTGSVACFITLISIPAIIRVAEQKGLYDEPDARKLHTRTIASLGGVGIFMGVLLAMFLTVSTQAHPEFQYFYGAATIIFFLGIKDDILILSPLKKFLIQLAAAAILIHLGGLRIDNMHGLLGIGTLPQAASLALTYSTFIVVINAFNLIDGVDGLAGTLGLLTMLVFGTYFTYIGLAPYGLFAFAMAGSLLAFLYFNFNPAKIFMGDSGSLLIGLVNAIMVIKFLKVAGNAADALPAGAPIALAVAILMVPLADTLRVFSIRILQGRSPFSPDRNHIHHLLLRRGMTAPQVTGTCLLLNVLFIFIAWSGRALGAAPMLLLLTALSTLFLSLLYVRKPVRRLVPDKALQPAGETVLLPHSPSKLVTMNAEMAVAEN